MAIKDITLFNSETEDSTLTVTGSSAVAVAIRNILLSEEGVFANLPSLNMDISKLMFDQIGDDDISTIKNNLYREIIKHIPNLSGVILDIKKIKLEDSDDRRVDGQTVLGVSITKDNQTEDYDLIVFKREGNLFVI